MPRTRIIILLVTLAFLISFTGCGRSPEDARTALEQMNIPYTPDAFINSTVQGDTPAVKLFLAAGMKPDTKDERGFTALMLAVLEDHGATVQVLLNNGADVNAKGKYGKTALMAAAVKGNTGIVQALLDAEADVNVEDKNGQTALLWATNSDHTEIVELLKAAGARE